MKDNPERVKYLMKQKEAQERKWRESVKAAKKIGIPIVKINREKVAKSECRKIFSMIEEFEMSKNPELLGRIITNFENNRIGNCGPHELIVEKYFSQGIMSDIINGLKKSIDKEENDIDKNNLYISLYKAIVREEEKLRELIKKKELADIEQILTNANVDYNEILGRKK